jgi:GNAT superfamily N-acetyltransferase
MQDILPEGGVDPQIVDRRNRQIPRAFVAARSREPAQSVRRRRVRRVRSQLRRSVDFARSRRARLFPRRRDARGRRAAARLALDSRDRRRRRSASSKPWQSHGVGSALLRRTLLTARNRGFRLLHMACLADNRRMQQLARKFDAELSFDFGSVVGEVESSRQPVVGDAGAHGRWPRLRHRDARSAIADAAGLIPRSGKDVISERASEGPPERRRGRADRPLRRHTARRRPTRATRTARSARPRTRRAIMPARAQIVGDLPARRFAQPRQRDVRRVFAPVRLESEPLQQPLMLRLQLQQRRDRRRRATRARGLRPPNDVSPSRRSSNGRRCTRPSKPAISRASASSMSPMKRSVR